MKVISAKHHFAFWKVLPMVVFVGFLALLILRDSRGVMKDPVSLAVFLLICTALSFFALGTVRSKVDEVQDHGNYLLVRKSGRTEKIPLNAIINVSCGHSSVDLIPVMRLVLERPGVFGDQIEFVAAGGFIKSNSGSRIYNVVAEDLTKRVDAARRP